MWSLFLYSPWTSWPMIQISFICFQMQKNFIQVTDRFSSLCITYTASGPRNWRSTGITTRRFTLAQLPVAMVPHLVAALTCLSLMSPTPLTIRTPASDTHTTLPTVAQTLEVHAMCLPGLFASFSRILKFSMKLYKLDDSETFGLWNKPNW